MRYLWYIGTLCLRAGAVSSGFIQHLIKNTYNLEEKERGEVWNIYQSLKKSVVAGLMIGIGCTVFLNMDNSIVASFLFGLGLFTIINLELNLFTGKIGYICKENCAETLITLVGNGIGVNIMAFLMKQTRVGVRLVEKAGPIVETKLSDTYISLFLLAVCCGMLMYIAVATFKKQPNILGTIAVFLCVSVFILAGFEHCIANMFYFGLVSTPTKYAVRFLL